MFSAFKIAKLILCLLEGVLRLLEWLFGRLADVVSKIERGLYR